MSPFVLIALAALLGFIVGWFAHGPKEPAVASVAVPPAPVGPNPLAAEVEHLKQELATVSNRYAGLESMVHGRDATITALAKGLQAS